MAVRKSPAERRLDALLKDEEYGPPLVRLNKGDERKVLDLIDANKGRDARKLILELDAKRRTHERTRARVRRYRALPPRMRRESRPTEERNFWEMYDAMVSNG